MQTWDDVEMFVTGENRQAPLALGAPAHEAFRQRIVDDCRISRGAQGSSGKPSAVHSNIDPSYRRTL